MWIEERIDEITEKDIVLSSRVGIESAGAEWASKLLRFYVFDNKNVSVRDRKREAIRSKEE
jgi:DNA-3-methyladenine glycosylase